MEWRVAAALIRPRVKIVNTALMLVAQCRVGFGDFSRPWPRAAALAVRSASMMEGYYRMRFYGWLSYEAFFISSYTRSLAVDARIL